MKVFIVHHIHESDNHTEDTKLIGVYSSRERAKDAIARLRTQPGFSQTQRGFHIDTYTLDADCWTEGFVTIGGEESE